jgi:hypothetical protein
MYLGIGPVYTLIQVATALILEGAERSGPHHGPRAFSSHPDGSEEAVQIMFGAITSA